VLLVTVYQVPGLAPPGVVIPQLASTSRLAVPGPPGVVIPQLASAPRLGIPGPGVVIPQLSTTGSCLLLTDNLFLKLSLKIFFLSFGQGLR